MILTSKDLELEFCMECGNPNPPDREICECGSRTFIFGNNFTYENKKVICQCGNDEFKFTARINMSPIHNTTYACTTCNNPVATQTYCEGYY